MVGMAVHQPHPFLQLVHGFNILRNSLRFANSSRFTAIWSPPFGFPVHRSLQVFRQSTNFISPVETGKALLEKKVGGRCRWSCCSRKCHYAGKHSPGRGRTSFSVVPIAAVACTCTELRCALQQDKITALRSPSTPSPSVRTF